MKLQTKLLIFLLPVIVLSGAVITLLINKTIHRIVVEEVEKRGLFKAQDLADESGKGFLDKGEKELLPTLHRAQEQTGALYAMILDPKGKVLAHTNVLELGKTYADAETQEVLALDLPNSKENAGEGQPVLDIAIPVWKSEESLLFTGSEQERTRLGTLRFGLPLSEALQTEKRITRQVLLIIAAISSLALIVALFFVRSVLLSVQLLVKGTENVSRGEYGKDVPVLSRDELGNLAKNFNQMSHALKETIDKLKEAQEKIIRSEKLAAIGQLASGVGHELRNPLGAINNAIYYIKDVLKGSSLAQEDPTVYEFIEVAEREIRNSTNIVNDLLDFSRVVTLNPKPCDVHALLLEMEKVIEVPAGVKIDKRFAPDLPEVRIDPEKMRQVFINLANNAIQSMLEGGTLTLTTRWSQNSNPHRRIEILFRDSGSGITQEHLKKIFEPLFTTKAKGTGLGLAICKSLVEKHGGQIWVESRLGEGSTFTIALPLDPDSTSEVS